MLFSQVPGNVQIKSVLIKQVLQNRISHAQLFFGPEGSGSLAMALAFSRFVMCKQKTETDACGTCSSCIKFDKLVHPDFHMVFPVNTNNVVKKDPTCDDFIKEWRSAITDNPYLNQFDWLKQLGIENKQGNIGTEEGTQIIRKLSLTTYEGDYKIMLIWMPESMNATASNKLLKILEEPPKNTLFLLVAESKEQLLATIQSRVQAIRFRPIADVEMRSFLTHETDTPEQLLNQIILLAEGNANKALNLSKTYGAEANEVEAFLDWMRMCYKINMPKLLTWVDQKSGSGRENQKNFLSQAIQMMRQTLMLHLKLPALVKLSEQNREQLEKFAKFVHPQNGDELLEAVDKAYYSLERNASPKILFLHLSFKIHTLLNRKPETNQAA